MKRLSFLVAFVAAFIFTVADAGPARATSVPAFTTEQLTAQADVVARVTIVARRVERVGRAGRIATFYEAQVTDVLRAPAGAAPTTVRIALPGGVLDGIGQVVPGTPVLEVGDDVVVFLSAPVGPKGARATIGLWQGVLHVGPAAGAPLFPATHDGTATTPLVDLQALRARVAGVPR